MWITCSDNFASWGGGGAEYHTEDLNKLIKAVDYVSLHTYPMHDTHYNPAFWGNESSEMTLSDSARITAAMLHARDYAITQYQNTVAYIKDVDPYKAVHIGETGWASFADHLYGVDGSKACDEYKEGLYHELIREWTQKNGIACFYFEAFDEPWKGGNRPGDSEKHFGIFDVDGKAKYAVWDLVDQGVFKGLSRGGNPIVKTYGGNLDSLMKDVALPPLKQ
jgi:exo-beta-1,3-glucanase (GH17 family)